MRTQGTDENIVLTPVRQMSIAEQLSMLNTCLLYTSDAADE